MKLPFYISEELKAYFEVASIDRRALFDDSLFDIDPLTCKKEYLPLLAIEVGVDINGFDEQTQRELIAGVMKANIKAGTVGALKESLQALGDTNIEELPNYKFNILLPNNKEVTVPLLQKFMSRANKAKNVRSVLNKAILKQNIKTAANVVIANMGSVKADSFADIKYEQETVANFPFVLNSFVGSVRQRTIMEVN